MSRNTISKLAIGFLGLLHLANPVAAQSGNECPYIKYGVRYPDHLNISASFPGKQIKKCFYKSEGVMFYGFQVELSPSEVTKIKPTLYGTMGIFPCIDCQIIEDGKIYSAKSSW